MSNPQCTTCHVAFENAEEMRKHFGSEFHVANVRLRVEGRGPLTKQQFNLQTHQDDSAGPAFSCNLCKKTFRSVQTLQSHVKSTEHLMRKEARIIQRDSNAGSMLSSTSLGSAALGLHRRHKAHHKDRFADPTTTPLKVAAAIRENDVDENTCFFCGLPSKTVSLSLDHMRQEHEFTLPLAHRINNLVGLLQYLARKVNGCLCLVCGANTKKFDSLEALRHHMIACQHDYVVLSPEYQEFYDGRLDDPEAVCEPIASDTLVVVQTDRDGRTHQRAIVRRNENHLLIRRTETEKQTVERRAITAAANEASALILRERAEATKGERKKELNLKGHCEAARSRHTMELGVRSNKLHPKGFDGEGLRT